MNIERLTEVLNYNPLTGVFKWKVTRNGRAKAGDTAGSISHSNSAKYLVIFLDGKSYKAHRLAWLACNGELPNGVIDHINGDSLDNRIGNLRDVSQSVNRKNSSFKKPNMCVGVIKDGKSYRAFVGHEGKKISLGSYASFELAKDARKEAEKKYGYSSSHGRKKTESSR